MRQYRVGKFVRLLTAAVLAGCGGESAVVGPRPTAPVAARQVAAQPGGLIPGKRAPQRSGVVRAAAASALTHGSRAFAFPDAFASVRRIEPNVLASPFVTTAPQNETTIAVSPADPARLVASSNDYRGGGPACGAYASTDGGASWRDIGNGLAPEAAGFTSGGDPAVAFGPRGSAYFSCLQFSSTTGASGIFVSTSTDLRSVRLLAPVVVDTAGSRFFNDKDYLAIDTSGASPYRGRLYVTWTRFESDSATGAFVGSPIYIAYSTNHGQTWSAPHPVTPPALSANQGSIPAVGPNGELYVAFENFNTTSVASNQLLVAKSLDGGRTFSAPVKAADVYDICPQQVLGECALLNSHFRVNSFPSIAVDSRRGNVFVAWGDYRLGSAKAFAARSTDGGATWSASRAVSNASPNDQVFPWVATTPDGAANVVYYDRRDDPANFLLSVYLSAGRSGGGLNFNPAVRVTTGPSNPDVQFGGTFIGDYIGMAGTVGRVNPIWTDTRKVTLGAPRQAATTSVVLLTDRNATLASQ